MTNKIKVMTLVGTRPEIIRLSATIKLLDKTTNHILVHTGQNYDYELNEVFFEDLGLRKPDYFLNADVSSLGATLGSILQGTEQVILKEQPDAMLILGDTNSCISAIMGKRMKVPVYHMEAGNRCFDENVPEETNRRLVDHVADYNLVYSEHARRNLLSEGIHPSRILLTGSPMKEVLDEYSEDFLQSSILQSLSLESKKYFLVSLHREENVESKERLEEALISLQLLSDKYQLPVLVSTHPRTRKRLESNSDFKFPSLIFHKPFGFIDYISLQQSSKLVLSDSGTISEESSILGFPAVSLREQIERPEALDSAAIILAGTDKEQVFTAVELCLSFENPKSFDLTPEPYLISNVARRVVSFIVSTALSHNKVNGIRSN
jgi:UDP-N-acetyl-L-fucosamine synthase